MKPMEKMCDNCPFGHSPKQRQLRQSLRPGRFDEICQSIFLGGGFICHKTVTHDNAEFERQRILAPNSGVIDFKIPKRKLKKSPWRMG